MSHIHGWRRRDSKVRLLWKRFDVKQDNGAANRKNKKDRDFRRRALHGCEQRSPSFVSTGQVSKVSPHAHQDARRAGVADVQDVDRLSGYSRTVLLLAAGLRAHEAGVAAGELVVELTAHLSSCSRLLRRECLGRGCWWCGCAFDEVRSAKC